MNALTDVKEVGHPENNMQHSGNNMPMISPEAQAEIDAILEVN